MDLHVLGIRRQSEALWSWNLVSNRVHFSAAWLRLVGCEEHEIGNTPQAWLDRVHPDDTDQVSSAIDGLLTAGSTEFEIRHRMRHKDGSYHWTLCRGVVQRNAAQHAVQIDGTHSDVTAETVSDPLTGLPNKLLFVEHLARAIERASRYPGYHFAVLCIDLGRPVDAEGTPGRAAHLLLSAAARRLETCLRTREVPPTLRNHDLVARLQDDVFAILLDGLKDVGHATIAADRILAEMLAPFALGGHEVRLSASIGIAVSATGYTLADDVLRDADTALHRARLLGRARCEVFDTAVLQSAHADLQLEADFEGALERDEFLLFYQPIVSLTSNQIVGFEALVRWQHPVLGLIPPLEFIPIAEKTGFIAPLGRWVLREACVQLKAWQNSIPLAADLWVSINLSSLQFRHKTLIAEIVEILHDCSLDARCLVLELTEGIALENPDAVRTQLMQLRALGVRVSVDDFGTGYSSLAYLRQLPLDSLKVDRAFVRGIEANQDMVSILAAITGMAQQLGLQVVVEGIEKEEQLGLIRSLNCGFAQGYLFSRPLDRDGTTALLNAGLSLGLAAPARSGAEAPESWWRTRKMGYGYAAAALLVLMVSVGVPRYMTREPSSAPVPGISGSAVATLRTGDVELRAPVDATKSATAPAPTAPVVERQDAVPRRAANAPVATPRAVTAPSSLRVVHQHRLGSCRGLLVVSRDGVAFVPDEHGGEAQHGFSLRPGQFLHGMGGDNLTIKSNDRVYRFKPAVVTGKDDDQLKKFVASLTRVP